MGAISALAKEQDVVRCWIPLESAREKGVGTLEFEVRGQRRRFTDVKAGDVLMFSPWIPHRVLFPPNDIYEKEDRCVLIASLHGHRGTDENPLDARLCKVSKPFFS